MTQLSQLFKDKKLKQVDVAEQLGVTTFTVNNWSAGRLMPRKKNIEKLAKLLDMPPKELISVFI